MPKILNKVDIEWGQHPEGFECRLYRQERPDPNNPNETIIVWWLNTGYDVLTQEGERIPQDDRWQLPNEAVVIAEQIRALGINRVKQKNNID